MSGPDERAALESIEMASGGRQRRLLLVAYHFPPSRLMGAQACAQIARYLPEYGWEPIVLTVEPRFLSECDPTTMAVFPGKVIRTRVLPHPIALYGRLRNPGWREASTPTSSGDGVHRRSRLKRWVRSLVEIPDHLTGWVPVAVTRGYSIIRSEGIGAILSSAPYWTNHLVGLTLKRLTGLPWVAHFRDPWTKNPAYGTTAVARAIERRLERMVVTSADWVVCVTDRHTDDLRRGHARLPAAKFVTIPNGYSPDEFEGLPGDAPRTGGDASQPFVMTYTGSLYIGRNVTPVLIAVRRLIDDGELSPHEIVVNLVGACETAAGRSVREIAQEFGLEAVVRLLGTVSRRDALRFMVSSDLLLLLAEDLTVQVPGKAYEYLRAGRPILALAPEGATADLIRKTGAGDVVSPADIAGIAGVVRRHMRRKRAGHPSPGADPCQVRHYDRRTLTGRLAALLESHAPGDLA
jgi:hypothetical protein